MPFYPLNNFKGCVKSGHIRIGVFVDLLQRKKHVIVIDTLILNICVHKHMHKMMTCNQCHIKKCEVEFTKGKAVCKSCRAAIIKAERTKGNVLKMRNNVQNFTERQRIMATAA